MRGETPAVLDVEHRLFVNWETFYFSDAQAKASFAEAPHRYSGKLTDPVSRNRFQPSDASPKREFRGRVFYFNNEENTKKFDAAPENFEKPVVGMQEMKG